MEKGEAPPRQERRLRMTYEEFLAWANEDVHAEWVDGEVIVFVPPKTVHQDVVGFPVNDTRRYLGIRSSIYGLELCRARRDLA